MIESFENYLVLEKQMSSHTVNAYVKDVQSFFEIADIAPSQIKEVTYKQIRSWMVMMLDAQISPRSVNRKISSLKAYFRFLLKIGEISDNPFSQHQPLKIQSKIQIPFSQKEMRDCLEKISFPDDFEGCRDKLILEILYSTGMRRSELLNIKRSDISLSEGMLKVLGKRNKERLLPITSTCMRQLKRYFAYKKNSQGDDFLLVDDRGEPLKKHKIYQVVNTYMSQVSSKDKTSPHIIRHSIATHLLDNGANLNDVKELLGHTSLAATQVYTHSGIGELKKQYANAHPRSNNNK